MESNEKTRAVVSVNLSLEEEAKLKAIAKADGRTVSNLVRRMISNELNR